MRMLRNSWRGFGLAPTIAAAALACSPPGDGGTPLVTPGLYERTGFVPRAIGESSGVAVSRTYPGVLWTHNDSGDDAVLYAIDMAGNLIGRFPVSGARNRDWEDIDLGPCQVRSPSSARCPR